MSASFNREVITAHVGLLHQLADGCDGALTLVSIEEGKTPRVRRFGVGQTTLMVDAIMGSENHPGLNIYAPWCVMRRDLEPNKKGGVADIIAVHAAAVDLDHDKYSLGELPIEAPYIVETSAGNYQAVYPFTRALPVSEAKPILEALSDAIGGDAATKDSSHVWRIPGTANWPTKSKLARGRSPDPQPVTVKKPFEGVLVNPEELAASLPRKTNGHAARDRQEPLESLASWEEDLLRDALGHIPADDYHTWIDVGMALHWAGLRELWDEWSATSDKFNAAVQAPKWASFNAEREGNIVTTGTIYKLAGEHGWVAPPLFGDELFAENLKRAADRANGHEVLEPDRVGLEPDLGGITPAQPLVDADFPKGTPQGVIFDITKWILSKSRRPQPRFAIASAFAIVATVASRQMLTPEYGNLLLYQTIIAGTARGKDAPLRAIRSLFTGIGMPEHLGPSGFRSDVGLVDTARRTPACVMVIDEFGDFLSSMTSSRAQAYARDALALLRELYGCATHNTRASGVRPSMLLYRPWFLSSPRTQQLNSMRLFHRCKSVTEP